MAPESLTATERKLVEEYRKLESAHNEFSLTITGFLRGGKRQIVIEPKPRLYCEERAPLPLAIDD